MILRSEFASGGHGVAAIEAAPPLRSVSRFASGKTDETHACVTSDASHPPRSQCLSLPFYRSYFAGDFAPSAFASVVNTKGLCPLDSR
ncbi:hypothetical protein EON80_31985, partial [bacterium]